jgi:hypothetical protein
MEEKHWKHKDGDWDTRAKFDQYMKVYERILNRCNDIPWTVVPDDRNWQKLYAVATVVLKTLKELDTAVAGPGVSRDLNPTIPEVGSLSRQSAAINSLKV